MHQSFRILVAHNFQRLIQLPYVTLADLGSIAIGLKAVSRTGGVVIQLLAVCDCNDCQRFAMQFEG
jgi:hypothetical protein